MGDDDKLSEALESLLEAIDDGLGTVDVSRVRPAVHALGELRKALAARGDGGEHRAWEEGYWSGVSDAGRCSDAESLRTCKRC